MNRIAFSTLFSTSLMLSAVEPEQNNPSTKITVEVNGRSFGDLVEAYDKGRKDYAPVIFDFLEKYVSKDTAVLDIGCGTGKSTRPLFERFSEVHGVDHDPKMLAYARKDSVHATQYKEGSVYNLPYDDGKFGLVTMASSFHWFADAKAVKEISRVLNNDGYVYIIQAGGTPLGKGSEAIISSLTGIQNVVPHRGTFHPKELLAENGFNLIEATELEFEHTYTIDETLVNYQSHSTWNFVKEAGKEKEALVQLRAFLEQNANEQGLIVYKAKAKVYLAQKAKN